MNSIRSIVAASVVALAPLGAQDAPAQRLLGAPGPFDGSCTVARVGLASSPRDTNTVRTLVINAGGRTVRRITLTDDRAGQPVQLSDVLFTTLENVEVRYGGSRPRVSWHTTEDAGLPDSAAAAAAGRLAALMRRRCPVR